MENEKLENQVGSDNPEIENREEQIENSAEQIAENTAESAEARKQYADKMHKEFENFKKKTLLSMIDHTLLKQDVTEAGIKKLCNEADKYGFYGVCVHPVHIRECKRFLKPDGNVKIISVVGFPFGEELTKVKAYQARMAVKEGAHEIDMVINISKVKAGDYRYVKREIKKVIFAARGRDVKVILETCLLTPKEMEKSAAAAAGAGAEFVKTSTGYFGEGATVVNVKILKSAVGAGCKVKASGGIRSAEEAIAMVEAGAERLGTSSGVKIAEELEQALPSSLI